jgi:predicted MPP superfamily phosphohydrolase
MKRSYTEENLQRIKDSGVELLIDRYIIRGGIAFGGLASGLILEDHVPDLAFIEAFSRLSEPKVLLCHHPEYYEPYVKNLPIELTLSGHAHGGQWRFFGRGVYAPGQGLFPKYTSGMHEGRFIISRGLKRTFFPPRIFNPTEIVIIDT